MLSCVTCIFCYQGHPNFSFLKHLVIPIFGIVANLICMGAYIVLPFMGYGTKMEPFLALGLRQSGRSMEGSTSFAPARRLVGQLWSPVEHRVYHGNSSIGSEIRTGDLACPNFCFRRSCRH